MNKKIIKTEYLVINSEAHFEILISLEAEVIQVEKFNT